MMRARGEEKKEEKRISSLYLSPYAGSDEYQEIDSFHPRHHRLNISKTPQKPIYHQPNRQKKTKWKKRTHKFMGSGHI